VNLAVASVTAGGAADSLTTERADTERGGAKYLLLFLSKHLRCDSSALPHTSGNESVCVPVGVHRAADRAGGGRVIIQAITE
jgi:hypothetical protein